MKSFFIAEDLKKHNLPDGLINSTLADALTNNMETGNELPDFDGAIFKNEVEEIVEDCKKHEINKFTISSQASGLQKTIAEFIRCGCRLEGLTKVKQRYTSEENDAFVMSI